MQKKLLNALKWIVDILNKHEIQYQITGGFAAYIYGAKRRINDIDIDVPEEDFEKIYDDVKKFVVFGPAQYRDKKWDLKLMTLDFHGQKIDISGAFNAKIFDDVSKKWLLSPVDFSKTRTMNFENIKIRISDPVELMEYKELLSGEHQKSDIAAIKKYLKQNI
jgi:hypothetical protein